MTVSATGSAYLTAQQQQQVAQLAKVDQKVRAHEQAHLLAAGPYARSSPSYQYVTGPDGQQYAVGGEVAIDVSAVPGDPEATIEKARTVQRAASAPADPSAQDRAVAAAAASIEQQALAELASQRYQSHGQAVKGSRFSLLG